MSQRLIIPRDVEDVLRLDLTTVAAECGLSFGISGTPVPNDLGKKLPYAVVYGVGGFKNSRVADVHAVSIDVYGRTWARAMDAANKLSGIVEELQDIDELTVDYLGTAITALPYNNPDPDHPDLPRVTFAADVTIRSAVI